MKIVVVCLSIDSWYSNCISSKEFLFDYVKEVIILGYILVVKLEVNIKIILIICD